MPFLKGMIKMTDLDQIKDLQERKSQLQAKYQSLKADAIQAMVDASDESRAIMVEFDSLSKEIQTITQQYRGNLALPLRIRAHVSE